MLLVVFVVAFPTLINEVRNLTTQQPNEECSHVTTELFLHPLTGECLSLLTSSDHNGARLDIRVQSFWGF